MWKFKWLKGKDKWLFLLTAGVILCILAFPAERLFGQEQSLKKKEERDWLHGDGAGDGSAVFTGGDGLPAGAREVSAKAEEESYEAELERRIKEILSHVEGVGEVDVMVVLESSSEKIWQSDGSSSTSLTDEKDSGGGSRRIENRETEHSTVLVSESGKTEPMLTKELRPQISGIIISASGGGSPAVQAEISAAMEALFGLPAHKIKVLKRVEPGTPQQAAGLPSGFVPGPLSPQE